VAATSAETGDRVGMRRLGTFLAKAHPQESKEWYRRASDAGDPWASCCLGDLVAEENPELARMLWERAAEDESPAALHRLGRWWAPRNPSTSVDWFRRAFEAGDKTAMIHLVRLLNDLDPVEAEVWRTRMEASSEAPTLVALAVEVAGLGDTDRAIGLLERASEAGDSKAIARAGRIAYEAGEPLRGQRLLEQAAADGNAYAMALLFKHLMRSDRRTAWAWARKAERSDTPGAWAFLASELAFRRPIHSHRLLRRAAQAGDPHARGVLAARTSVLEPLENWFRSDASIRQARRREWAAQAAAAGNKVGTMQHAVNLFFAGEKVRAEAILEKQAADGFGDARIMLGCLHLVDRQARVSAALLVVARASVRSIRRHLRRL
jgi:hypothetical protein